MVRFLRCGIDRSGSSAQSSSAAPVSRCLLIDGQHPPEPHLRLVALALVRPEPVPATKHSCRAWSADASVWAKAIAGFVTVESGSPRTDRRQRDRAAEDGPDDESDRDGQRPPDDRVPRIAITGIGGRFRRAGSRPSLCSEIPPSRRSGLSAYGRNAGKRAIGVRHLEFDQRGTRRRRRCGFVALHRSVGDDTAHASASSGASSHLGSPPRLPRFVRIRGRASGITTSTAHIQEPGLP